MTSEGFTISEDLNALEIIFQKHFYASSSLLIPELTKLVAMEYLEYLILKRGAFVPERFRNTVLQELMVDVKERIQKKITGYSSIEAYHKEHNVEVEDKRQECEKKYYDLF